MRQVDKKKRRRIEIAAYHEAGHAVMAVLTRTPLRDTTIVASRLGASSGQTRLERSRVSERRSSKAKLGPRGHRQILGRACFDIAGEIAARRFAPSSWRTLHSRSDLANLSGLLDTLGLSEVRLKALAKAIVVTADSLIQANWTRVEAVASELLKRGTLTGTQVRKIVAGRIPPRPS
jgi:hypothetical protein